MQNRKREDHKVTHRQQVGNTNDPEQDVLNGVGPSEEVSHTTFSPMPEARHNQVVETPAGPKGKIPEGY